MKWAKKLKFWLLLTRDQQIVLLNHTQLTIDWKHIHTAPWKSIGQKEICLIHIFIYKNSKFSRKHTLRRLCMPEVQNIFSQKFYIGMWNQSFLYTLVDNFREFHLVNTLWKIVDTERVKIWNKKWLIFSGPHDIILEGFYFSPTTLHCI